MKILLVYPSRVGRGNIPINIPILQAALKQAGHEVQIFDTNSYRWPQWGLLQTKLGMFKKTDEYEYNKMLYESDPFADLENICRKFGPQVIAVSCLTTDFIFSLDLVKTAKKVIPSLISLYGGIHPIIASEAVLAHADIDFVCTGEGEEAIVEFVDNLQRGRYPLTVRNIWGKRNGSVVKSHLRPLTSLDSIPFQDLSGFEEFHFYRPFDGKIHRMANVEVSRGCFFPCSYCVNQTLKEKYNGLGKYHRIKSIDRAIAELVFLKQKHGFEFIRFWDEDFTSHSLEFLKDFAIAYQEKIGLPFLIYARCESITGEKVKVLKEMGCKTFAVGIESGSEWMRKNVLNRHVSNDTIIEKFNLIHKHGMRVSAYNMIGYPFETRKMIFETIELNRRCRPATSSVVFLEPYPGTKIMEMLIQEKLIPPDYVAEYKIDEPHFTPKLLTKKELAGLLRTFSLYTKLPKYTYPLLRISEGSGIISDLARNFLVSIYAD